MVRSDYGKAETVQSACRELSDAVSVTICICHVSCQASVFFFSVSTRKHTQPNRTQLPVQEGGNKSNQETAVQEYYLLVVPRCIHMVA